MEKRTVFNLIVLDESGSMGPSLVATISGCNEILETAKSHGLQNADKERSLMSIYAFQSGTEVPSRYLVKNMSVDKVRPITGKDYRPWGATPLYDAIGTTLTELESVASTHEDAIGIVTIITDGYENSSRQFNVRQVRDLISRLKELGWTINIIGANVDIEKMGDELNIDNRMSYESTERGTKEMFGKFKDAMSVEMSFRICDEAEAKSRAERLERRKARARNYFKRPDGK